MVKNRFKLLTLVWHGAAYFLVYRLLCRFANAVLNLTGGDDRLSGWDASCHGMDGVQFARSFQLFDLRAFMIQLGHSTYWPPLYPLIEAVAFSIYGYHYIVARHTMLAMAVSALVLVFFSSQLLSEFIGAMIGVLSVFALIHSDIFTSSSLVEMLEVPGVLFGFAAMTSYLYYLKNGRKKAFTLACFFGTCLFLEKFNFFLMWFLPFLIFEFYRHKSSFFTIAALTKDVLFGAKWRNITGVLSLVYLAVLAAVSISGGWDFTAYGQHVQFHSSLGNPLYALIILLHIHLRVSAPGALTQFYKGLWAIDDPVATILRWIVLPMLVWFTYPPNFNTFFYAITNNSEQSTSFTWVDLTYYPRLVLAKDFSTALSLGYFVVGGFFVAMPLAWKFCNTRQRFFAFVSVFGMFLCTIHPHHDPRFFVTQLPLMVVTSFSGLMTLAHVIVEKIIQKFSRYIIWSSALSSAWLTQGTLILLTLGGLVPMYSAVDRRLTKLQEQFDVQTFSGDYVKILDYICQEAEITHPTAVFGFSFFLSPDLIKWHCLAKNRDLPFLSVPFDSGSLGKNFDGNDYADIVNQEADGVKMAQWLVISPASFSEKDPEPWRDPSHVRPFPDFLAKSGLFNMTLGYESSTLGIKVYKFRLPDLEEFDLRPNCRLI